MIRIVFVLALLGLLGSGPGLAADRQATNIPQQDLGSALRHLAKQRDLQIIFASQDVKKRRTQGAVGELTDLEALERLLEGTGLTYQSLDAKTLTLTPVQAKLFWAPFPEPLIPEVEISAQHESLRLLRMQLARLEDRFFAEYNALNPNNQFDIHCDRQSPTGSHIDRRFCRPVFVDRAFEDGRARCYDDSTSSCAYNVRPYPSAIILAKSSAYEKNVQEMIGRHAPLRKIVREHEDLQERYNDLRRRAFRDGEG